MTGEKPKARIDISKPETFGVHLEYMSSELHSIDKKLDHIGESVAHMLQTIPTIYAPITMAQQNSVRISSLEQNRDIHTNDGVLLSQLTADVREIRTHYAQMRGGFVWLQVFIGALALPVTGLLIAVAKLMAD